MASETQMPVALSFYGFSFGLCPIRSHPTHYTQDGTKCPRGHEEWRTALHKSFLCIQPGSWSGHLHLPDVSAVTGSQLTGRRLSGEAACPPAHENPCSIAMWNHLEDSLHSPLSALLLFTWHFSRTQDATDTDGSLQRSSRTPSRPKQGVTSLFLLKMALKVLPHIWKAHAT